MTCEGRPKQDFRQVLIVMHLQIRYRTNPSELLKLEEIAWEHLSLLEKPQLLKLEEVVLIVVGRQLAQTGIPLEANETAMKVTPFVSAFCICIFSVAAFLQALNADALQLKQHAAYM